MMRRALLIVALVAANAVAGGAQQASPELTAPPDVAAVPANAEKSASGLASRQIVAGSGTTRPSPTDYVRVHYTGWTSEGRMFDSSYTRNNPPMFPLNRALVGWRECVQLMTVGEKRRCWLTPDLAYRGAAGRPTGPVVFDIELLALYADPHVAPPDVKAMPPDVQRTATGIGYRVLQRGVGARQPTPYSRVTVHYTGWTTDGKMFDSSVARGTSTSFRLDDVIAGWTEGVGLMVEGERRRFWIPQELAYKGEAGSPRGMLVFDIELIRIDS